MSREALLALPEVHSAPLDRALSESAPAYGTWRCEQPRKPCTTDTGTPPVVAV